jgi:hypothetical protein
VLAKLPDENVEVTAAVQSILTEFVSNVFRHVEGKRVRVGRFLGAEEAAAHILASQERA